MHPSRLPLSPIVQKYLIPDHSPGTKSFIQLKISNQVAPPRILAPDGSEIKLVSLPEPVKRSSEPESEAVSKTIEALALAIHWSKLIDTGRMTSIDEIALREKLNPTKVRKILRLALLSPEIVQYLVAHPDVSLDTLKRKAIPVEWQQQVGLLSGISDTTSRH